MAQNTTAITHSFSSYFIAEKKYLVLPVKNGATKRNIEIWVDGILSRFFEIELAEGKPDWYSYLQIDEWKSKKVELRVDKITNGTKVFSPIEQIDDDTNANTYHEKLRGQFHFSPKRGWTNDPNGLVYFNNEYHLFFQHNPYGRGWGNMTWGHAVSKDLVHWKELGDVIHPNQGGPIFSGSAVVDFNNTSGLGKIDKPAMVMIHTGAKSWGQYLTWSTDGRTFQSMEPAILARINKDNRDPKIIWHEPTKKWIMVLWVERGNNEQHSMQFLTSPDLKNWTEASVVMGGIGNDRYLFECPELYELPVDGTTNLKKWVLTGANTQYATGTFDGSSFTVEQERLQQQSGRDYYAPQTFNNEPNGRRVEIGWWRTNTAKDSMTFNQSMSIPLELKLVLTHEGVRLTRMPVKELEVLRNKSYQFGKLSITESSSNVLKNINIELVELHIDFDPGKANKVVLNIRGVPVTYDVINNELEADGVKAPVSLINGKLKLVVFADRTGLEIFANNGLLFLPVNINLDDNNRSLSLSVNGGRVKISNLVVFELKSIWE